MLLKHPLQKILVFCACVIVQAATAATNDDLPAPDFGATIGSLLPSGHHLYIEDAYVNLPLLNIGPVTAIYRYHETTPFLRENAQAELFYTRYDFEVDLRLCDQAQLIAIAGYRHTQLEDRPGDLGGYVIGAGVGSPWRRQLDWLEWSVTAGGYVARDNLAANWWADGHGLIRVWRGPDMKMYETTFNPYIGIEADVDSANQSAAFHARYRVGPVLDFLSANQNQLRFEAQWYHTDGQPFYQDRDTGLLLGIEVRARLDQEAVFDARDTRPTGWLPLVWGDYDIGAGNDRTVERFELDSEIHDFLINDHRITGVLYYESRQEQRPGDFSNESYTVAPGIETPIGLASAFTQGEPLVLGCDYEHRSSHALDPDASRVPPGTYLERDSINILPRFRLQTLGWDMPYRDPAMYARQTEFLNYIDWRVTLGYDFHHSRDRSNPAAQFGANWDIASWQGNVIYARGIISIGDETPDWQAECGIRRRIGKIFFRAEQYGLESWLARGDAFVGGIGFFL